METQEVTYRPQKSGFPYKLLKYLYDENKVCSGVTAQKEIGLNAWADKKGEMYYHRASVKFDSAVAQLKKHGLVRILENDCYELTKKGRLFMRNYKTR